MIDGLPNHKFLVNFFTWMNLRNMLSNYPFDPEATRLLQLRKLRKLLIHSYENHEFYRQRMIDSRLDPHKLASLEELQQLPPLTKGDYRAFTYDLLKKNPDKYRCWYFDQTSGSSGTPLKIARTWQERGYMMAKWMRAIYLNGYRCTDHTLRVISPHRMSGKKDTILQHLGLFRFSLVSYYDSPREMVEALQRIHPDFFYANCGQAVQMAQYILEQGITIDKPRIYSVGAEVINENTRALLSSAFGRENFFENYGCEEMGNLAFQIMGENELNFCHDTNILELQNPDGSISDNRGECLITDLGISEFPLIRYRLGDTIETSLDAKGVRKIKAIQGRTEDWLFWKDGTKTSNVYFYEIMGRFSSSISQFKIIQENYDLIRILIILAPFSNLDEIGKNELQQKIAESLKKEMDQKIEYRIEYVKSISPDRTGKMGIMTSKVKRPV
jgi:phenylacetate-CoA ligase